MMLWLSVPYFHCFLLWTLALISQGDVPSGLRPFQRHMPGSLGLQGECGMNPLAGTKLAQACAHWLRSGLSSTLPSPAGQSSPPSLSLLQTGDVFFMPVWFSVNFFSRSHASTGTITSISLPSDLWMYSVLEMKVPDTWRPTGLLVQHLPDHIVSALVSLGWPCPHPTAC